MQPEQQTSWLMRLRGFADRRKIMRLQRKKRVPWMLRYCPENRREFLEMLLIYLGAFSEFVILIGALFGFALTPLAFVPYKGHKPIEIWMCHYVQWFQHHCSPENVLPAYLITQTCIFCVVMYFSRVFSWIVGNKRDQKLKQEILATSERSQEAIKLP
jgi:hypothetical protein